MVLLFALVGCTDVLRTPTGDETLRGALWFEDVLDAGSTQTHASLLILSNSSLPCNADTVEDDPDTTEDEAASAQIFWQGQIASAFTREGAFLVAIELLSHSTEWSGSYEIDDTTIFNPTAALALMPNPAWGVWFQIQEATLEDTDGFFYTYTPTLVEYDSAVAPPGTVNAEAGDDHIEGDFTFDADHVSGTYGADRCDNTALYNQLWQYVLNVSSVVYGGSSTVAVPA